MLCYIVAQLKKTVQHFHNFTNCAIIVQVSVQLPHFSTEVRKMRCIIFGSVVVVVFVGLSIVVFVVVVCSIVVIVVVCSVVVV